MSPAVPPTIRFAPDVPSLDALGAGSLDDLFASPPRVLTGARVERVGETWRIPLPGTPDEHGLQHERPRGAGTGHVLLRQWQSGALELARARLTAPRSSSVAARHWNLTCHLRAHGVVAPELVALAERGGPIAARESCLIVRELAGFVSLSRWLAQVRDAAERDRGVRSLGLAFAALLRCGVWLPLTTLENVHIASAESDCAALQIVNLQGEQALLRERDLERARLPAIAFTNLDRGRILPSIAPARRRLLVERLLATSAFAGELAPALRAP